MQKAFWCLPAAADQYLLSASSRQAVGLRLPGMGLFLAGGGGFALEAFPASHHAAKAACWHGTCCSSLLFSLC